MIESALLAIFQAAQEDLLPDTCTIQAPTVVKDAIGQPEKTWAARATGVACRLAAREVRELLISERNVPVGEWLLTVAHDQTIETGDRVLYGSRTFEVVGVEQEKSWQTARRCGLVEVS